MGKNVKKRIGSSRQILRSGKEFTKNRSNTAFSKDFFGNNSYKPPGVMQSKQKIFFVFMQN